MQNQSFLWAGTLCYRADNCRVWAVVQVSRSISRLSDLRVVIFGIRTYALYGCNRWIIVFIAFSAVTGVSVSVVRGLAPLYILSTLLTMQKWEIHKVLASTRSSDHVDGVPTDNCGTPLVETSYVHVAMAISVSRLTLRRTKWNTCVFPADYFQVESDIYHTKN